MTVRNAEEKDIDRLLELLTQVQAIHAQGRPDLFEGTHTKYRPDDLRAILRDEGRPSAARQQRSPLWVVLIESSGDRRSAVIGEDHRAQLRLAFRDGEHA